MTNGQRAKTAFIDTSAVGIMLPHFVWDAVLVKMKYAALFDTDVKYYINTVKLDNGMEEMQIPDHKCEDIVGELKPISFMLESTQMTIYPKGYTYMSDPDQSYCQIGLHPIADPHTYRLGNIFLRNFYTALDFEHDEILIGVNKGAADLAESKMEGHTADPNLPDPPVEQIDVSFVYLAFLLLDIIVFIYFFVEKRRMKRSAEKSK